MVSGRLYYDKKQYDLILENKMISLEKQIKQNFHLSKKTLSQKYITIAEQLMLDDNLVKLIQKRERELIYSNYKNRYKNLMKNDPHLYVMHFFDTKNTTILRMHKPESYDDILSQKRPLVAYVNDVLKIVNNFEVGKNGIVYRITLPFISKGKHLGVLEFGIKPDYFVDSISKNFKVESQILVDNDSLETLSRKTDFKKFGKYSIISQNKLFDKISSKIDMKKSCQIIRQNGESYIVITDLNFQNYKNKNVAKIIIAKDITEFIRSNYEARFFSNVISFFILLIALIFVYIVFTKYANEINKSYKKLSNLEKKSNYLKDKSHKDDLTNLHNKKHFNKYLNKHLKNNAKGVILFFDIDHFKNCNDTHGHLVGDEILIKLSKTIQTNLRDEDLFARWGGEEFVILLENININKAPNIAEKVRQLVENTEFTKNIKITISIGITEIKANDTLESLMLRADELLYRAKEEGRNRCISDIYF